MAAEHLGITFDIHGGGLDLIFPHHENEIAQSRCAHEGAPLAKLWMHNGFLTVNSDKMSKSLKNFFTIRELLAIAPGEALRLALLTGHYRQPLDFSVEALERAKATLDRWYGALLATRESEALPSKVSPAVETALGDDLNTPLAIADIHKQADDLFRLEAAADPAQVLAAKGVFLASAQALGLLYQDPKEWTKWRSNQASGPSDVDIEQSIADRLAARQAKNYTEADRIRDTLAAQGVILEDRAGQTTWRRG
jgi:cysteinyl-tRNA synthetase